jgi:hypothetical protein
MLDGIGPLSDIASILTYNRLLSCPMDAGRVPFSFSPDRVRAVKLEMAPMVEGTVPDISINKTISMAINKKLLYFNGHMYITYMYVLHIFAYCTYYY